MGKEIIHELIQNDLTINHLCRELKKILDQSGRNEVISAYKGLREKLGGDGASAKAAVLMSQYLTKK